jgi:hypothetical protein
VESTAAGTRSAKSSTAQRRTVTEQRALQAPSAGRPVLGASARRQARGPDN